MLRCCAFNERENAVRHRLLRAHDVKSILALKLSELMHNNFLNYYELSKYRIESADGSPRTRHIVTTCELTYVRIEQ